MLKRLLTAVVILAMALALAPPGEAVYITDPGALRGMDYTDIDALAAGLDRVFAGDIDLYCDLTCTLRANGRIGYRDVPLGRYLYVKASNGMVYSGTSCYIYANAVYATLFGDVPYHGESVGWRHSKRVMGTAASISYERFSAAGIKCGALLRTTPNRDGSYNSEKGHSIIILSYDANSLTYLEGNADGRGLIRVTTHTWAAANNVLFHSRGYRLSFIVQPTESLYSALRDGSAVREPELLGFLKLTGSYSGQFTDVSPGSWYADSVRTIFELGLMSGRSASLFAPGEVVTAAEAVTVAARFLSRYYDDRHVFTAAGSWFEPYYDYLALWGVDTSFTCPGSPITRGQFASLMAQVLPADARRALCPGATFPDLDSSCREAVELLAENGIVGGSGGAFRPYDTLSRSEAAAIFTRMADMSLRLG